MQGFLFCDRLLFLFFFFFNNINFWVKVCLGLGIMFNSKFLIVSVLLLFGTEQVAYCGFLVGNIYVFFRVDTNN